MDCVTMRNAAVFLLQLLQSLLVWPVAVIGLGLLFRQEINKLLARIKSGKAAGMEVTFGEPTPEGQPQPPTTTQSPASGGGQSRDAHSCQQMLQWERVFNYIWQSQWNLLKSLEDRGPMGVPLPEVLAFHDAWMKERNITQSVSEHWLRWLEQVGLVARFDKDDGSSWVHITDRGREFLSYVRTVYRVVPPRVF